MAKKKLQRAWVFTKPASKISSTAISKATKAEKEAISKEFESLVDELNKNLAPIPKPQQFNHCINVFTKWRGNHFYIKQKYKTGKNAITDFFEIGLARLEFLGEGQFNLSYFRHTGKWESFDIYENISIEMAKRAIRKDSVFQVF